MSISKKMIVGVLAGALVAGGVMAASHGENPAVKARQAHMDLNAFNLGILGAMAQGKAEYDADAAKAAAANLVALSGMAQMAYWPADTAAGQAEGSRALPALWENMADVGTKSAALSDAAAAMEAAAGVDLASLQGAMGVLGGACGGCHKAYRQPE